MTSSPRPRPLAGAPVSSRRSAPSAPHERVRRCRRRVTASSIRARLLEQARGGRGERPPPCRAGPQPWVRPPSAVVRKTGRPSPSSAARACVSGCVEPVDGRSRDARGLERANLGARHGMQAARDDEPGASPGHRRGRPRVAQMSGGELREPRGAREDHVRRRDAGGGERVEVGLRLRVGRDDAARGAPERRRAGPRSHRAHSRATGGARAARRRGAGCPITTEVSPGYAGSRPIAEVWAGSPSTRSTPPMTVRPLGGEARAHERRRPPRHLEEGLDLRGDGAAQRGVDLLEDEPGADLGRGGHGPRRGRAPLPRTARAPGSRCRRPRPRGVTSTRVASTNTPTLPRPEKCAPASQAPVRSSAMSVMVMRL